MRNVICLLTTALLAVGCAAKKPAAAPIVNAMPGSGRDAHGCVATAGYTFSQNRNKCISLSIEGIRLNPSHPSPSQRASAFVVFKTAGDTCAAELFLPDGTSFLMVPSTRSGAGTWTYKHYKLAQSKGLYTLTDASRTSLYQSPNPS
jgi:hypothetical protein